MSKLGIFWQISILTWVAKSALFLEKYLYIIDNNKV